MRVVLVLDKWEPCAEERLKRLVGKVNLGDEGGVLDTVASLVPWRSLGQICHLCISQISHRPGSLLNFAKVSFPTLIFSILRRSLAWLKDGFDSSRLVSEEGATTAMLHRSMHLH